MHRTKIHVNLKQNTIGDIIFQRKYSYFFSYLLNYFSNSHPETRTSVPVNTSVRDANDATPNYVTTYAVHNATLNDVSCAVHDATYATPPRVLAHARVEMHSQKDFVYECRLCGQHEVRYEQLERHHFVRNQAKADSRSLTKTRVLTFGFLGRCQNCDFKSSQIRHLQNHRARAHAPPASLMSVSVAPV